MATTKKPTKTLRDGALRATIWANESEKGTFYRTTLSRRYQDQNGDWKDSDSFTGADLLRIARLAELAYTETLSLRQESSSSPSEEPASSANDGRSV